MRGDKGSPLTAVAQPLYILALCGKKCTSSQPALPRKFNIHLPLSLLPSAQPSFAREREGPGMVRAAAVANSRMGVTLWLHHTHTFLFLFPLLLSPPFRRVLPLPFNTHRQGGCISFHQKFHLALLAEYKKGVYSTVPSLPPYFWPRIEIGPEASGFFPSSLSLSLRTFFEMGERRISIPILGALFLPPHA